MSSNKENVEEKVFAVFKGDDKRAVAEAAVGSMLESVFGPEGILSEPRVLAVRKAEAARPRAIDGGVPTITLSPSTLTVDGRVAGEYTSSYRSIPFLS